MSTDYSHWLTKQQAAQMIGVSTKTVEQLAAGKKPQLQSFRWKRPEGGPRIAVYHPGDVERVRKERNPDAPAFVVPPEPVDAKTTALARLPRETLSDMERMGSAVLQALISENSQKHPEVRLPEKLFLTIPEASAYSGMPQTVIRGLLRNGSLNGTRTGAGWRVARAALEAWALSQTEQPV